MPRTWRAGGIIGPTTAKTENAGAGEGGVADNSVGEAREVRAEETRKAAGWEAVEVVDKVEEPGVDAKVVEDPDLARSQLLEEPPGAAKEMRLTRVP